MDPSSSSAMMNTQTQLYAVTPGNLSDIYSNGTHYMRCVSIQDEKILEAREGKMIQESKKSVQVCKSLYKSMHEDNDKMSPTFRTAHLQTFLGLVW